MRQQTKIALIGASATILVALIAALWPHREDTLPKPTPSHSATVSGSAGVTIIQDSSNVAINQNKIAAESDVRFVDASARQTALDLSTIDLKLRNAGDKPGFAKSASVEIMDRVILRRCSRCPGAYVEPSHEYNLKVEGSSPAALSQNIPPQGVDRFSLIVQGDYFSQFAVYKVRVKITYNEEGKVVTSNPLFITFGPYNWSFPGEAKFACVEGHERMFEECVSANAADLKRIGYAHKAD